MELYHFFVRVAQFLIRIFYTQQGRKKISETLKGEPIFNPDSRKSNIERASMGLSEFDAEGVIDQSSPYKRTAERSSAAKKPRINNEETRRFSRRVSTYMSVL